MNDEPSFKDLLKAVRVSSEMLVWSLVLLILFPLCWLSERCGKTWKNN